MDSKLDDSHHGTEMVESGHVPAEPRLVPAPSSQRSSSFSTISTRTQPSTPATLRTEPAAARPQPPRRHTEKPALHRLPSIEFPPPFTQKSSILNHPGIGTTTDPYTERSYLFQSLQGQNERAKKLLQRLSLAEERLLLGCHGAGEARKIRKEMRLTKKKMADNEQQERLTLLRLGDLYVEIQARERRIQLQQQRMAGLVAQQQQQQQPAYLFASLAGHCRPVEDTTNSAESPDAVPPALEEMSPPPPPPPSAASCFFSSFLPLSPGSSCLSPLSPSFVPGLPFEETFFWSSGHCTSAPGNQADGSDVVGQDEEKLNERGRGHTHAVQASNRTCSVPRPPSYVTVRNRRASVPTVRLAWADEAVAAEA